MSKVPNQPLRGASTQVGARSENRRPDAIGSLLRNAIPQGPSAPADAPVVIRIIKSNIDR